VLHVQLSTIVFQIANFFVLLAVLTWFLYRPLQQTMRRRQDEITQRVRDAEERAQRADAERARLAVETQRTRTEAEAVLAGARAEASQLRQRLLDQARQEAARYAEDAHQHIEAQERAVRQHLEETVRHAAVAMAGTLIQQAAGPAVHHALIEHLLAGGLSLDADQEAQLRGALSRINGGVTVEAAYPLAPDLTEQIRDMLARFLGTPARGPEITVRVVAPLQAGVRILIEHMVIDLSLPRILAELEGGDAGR